MVLVRGLDRLDGTNLEGMSDELWSQHTAELTQRFQVQDPGPDAGGLGFTEFCARFDAGAATTEAMERHHRHFGGGGGGNGAPVPAPPPLIGGARGLGPRWTRGEIERSEGERNMGSWTAAVYTPEQQLRLGVDEMGEPTGATPPPGIGANMPPPAPGQPVIVMDGGQPVGLSAEERREQMRLAAERRAANAEAVRERRGPGQLHLAEPQAGGAAAGSRFPTHWGEPPLMQTKDLRPLPGGYGQGSGTLAAWIEEKLAQDAAGVVPPKTSWPELVGAAGDAAMAAIQAERPLLQVMTVPEDAMVTCDWREDRVRVFVKPDGTVGREPQIG